MEKYGIVLRDIQVKDPNKRMAEWGRKMNQVKIEETKNGNHA